MLEGGADGRYLARRLVRMAVEDIGLADPRAMQVTLNAAEVYDRLGSPEGELALAEATVYLCVAPKSNSIYKAWGDVQTFVKQDGSRDVPIHLRNSPTTLMKKMGYGRTYRYAHDEPNAYAAGENYLPEGMPPQTWYEPTDRGLEQKVAAKLAWLRSLDEAANRDESEI
jgi:putative ATPase